MHQKLDLHAIQLSGYQGFTALVFWLGAAPDPGAVRETWLLLSIHFHPVSYILVGWLVGWLVGGVTQYKEIQTTEQLQRGI